MTNFSLLINFAFSRGFGSCSQSKRLLFLIIALQLTITLFAMLLKHYQTAPLGMDRKFDFRISNAGAQEKTAFLCHHNKWHLPQGVTPTSHIIKLPIGNIKHAGINLSDSVENQWLCLQILSAFNLPVNQAQIVQFDDIKGTGSNDIL